MATFADKIGKQVEVHYPHVVGIAVGGAAYFFRMEISSNVKIYHLHVDQLYSSMFNIGSVLSGFLFTFYSFIMTTNSGFISKARSTSYLARANGFTVQAILSGGVLALATIPLLVVQPETTDKIWAIPVAAWLGLSCWALLAFERAARIFIIFASRNRYD